MRLLDREGVLVKSGTIVHATVITAPSSTKNATGTWDPEMKQVRKGNQWYFEMRVHVRTDRRGVVHSLMTTDAAASEINQLPHLVPGDQRALYGDRPYWSEADRQACEAAGIKYWMTRRAIRSPSAGADRSRSVVGPGPRRVRVSSGEVSVEAHEGALSRTRQEYGSGLHALRAHQPVSGTAPMGPGVGRRVGRTAVMLGYEAR